MTQDTQTTNVKFYMATYEPNESDEQSTKEVLAVFVDEIETNRPKDDVYYTCYVHLGGHTTCSKSFLAEKCKKITEKEQYQELFNELESIGYKLNVV